MPLTFRLFQRLYVLFKINRINKLAVLMIVSNLIATAAVAAALTSTVISTQKPASQLIDHLAPFIKPPASITAIDHQLVIRADRASVSEIKKILASIDVAPENLIIHIRQTMAPPTPISARRSTTKTINTRSLHQPKISTYKSIEGEELVIQHADAPDFLLQWPIQQSHSNPSFALTLKVQRIGERLQLRYRLEEILKEKGRHNAHKSIKVEGVLLGHMNSWIDLNAYPRARSKNEPIGTESNSAQTSKDNTRRYLSTERLNRTSLWQIKVQREH